MKKQKRGEKKIGSVRGGYVKTSHRRMCDHQGMHSNRRYCVWKKNEKVEGWLREMGEKKKALE